MATINLSWTPATGANIIEQRVYRGISSNTLSLLASGLSPTVNTYSDTTALDNTTYYYRIDSICTTGGPTTSSVVDIITACTCQRYRVKVVDPNGDFSNGETCGESITIKNCQTGQLEYKDSTDFGYPVGSGFQAGMEFTVCSCSSYGIGGTCVAAGFFTVTPISGNCNDFFCQSPGGPTGFSEFTTNFNYSN